ncbi:MAG: hypothetical protein ACLFR9_09755 [Desulfobacterales bacterium]
MTWVTPQLAVGPAPMSVAVLDSIKKQGIKAIMNLCMELGELAQLEFDQVKDLLAKTEADVPQEAARCGKHHTECCVGPVRLSLAEAIYLQFSLNSELGRELRQEAISRALQTGAPDCPIVRDGCCLLYEFRPAACRAFDRPGAETGVPGQQAEALQTLSDEILEIFLEAKTKHSAPEFQLSDVVSGKFVQRFFHLLPNRK